MGVGGNRKLDARLLCRMDMHVAQIHTIRLSVDFQMTAERTCRSDHALHVDIVRLARADQAPRGMGDDGHMRIVHGPDHAVGLRLARQIEIRMDCGHYNVELGQRSVR